MNQIYCLNNFVIGLTMIIGHKQLNINITY
jgi:hypothetical protein